MGLAVRTIGMGRAIIKICMANLAYNFQRSPGSRGGLRSRDGKSGPGLRFRHGDHQESTEKGSRRTTTGGVTSPPSNSSGSSRRPVGQKL
jgi:hypothetical protein